MITEAPSRPAAAEAAHGRRGLGYLPALDGIRGLSVLAVVAFHLGRFTGGYLGVDAFFVLSGFLITSLLLAEHDSTGTIHVGHFYVRRARRLLPALFVFLLGVAVWAELWALPGQLRDLREEAFAALLYVANWQKISSADSYWDLDAAPSPFDHMWSLAIEEQFYLLWPLLFLLLIRLGRGTNRRVGPAAAVLAAGSAVLMVAQYGGGDPNSVYMGTHTRAQAILLGAALGWLLSRRGIANPVPPAVGAAGVLAVPVLALMWWRVDGASEWMYRGGFTLHALLVATVIAAVAANRGLLARALGTPALRFAGTVSYGLYLYHWPAIVWLTPERTPWDGATLDAVRVAAAFAATIASYYLIERPLRFGSWVTPRRVAVAAPAGALAVGVVIAATMAPLRIGLERLDTASIPSAPAPTTTPAPTTSPPSGSEPSATTAPEASTTTEPEFAPPVPVELAPGERLRVAHVGDSIGIQVAPYLREILGEGVDFVDLTGAGSALCDWFPAMEAQAATPPHVFVIDIGGNALTPCMFGEDGQPMEGDEYLAKYTADTAYAIELARSMGARVLLVDQPVSRNGRASGTGELFLQAARADRSGMVRYFSTWPAITPGGVFVQTASCEEWEPGCIGGEGELRSPPPGVHLEPLGQFRYALAIRDDLAAAGWLPSGGEG